MAVHVQQDQHAAYWPPITPGSGDPARTSAPNWERALCFSGARGNGRPMSENAILAAMRRMDIAKHEMSGHGFRAVARTSLMRCSVSAQTLLSTSLLMPCGTCEPERSHQRSVQDARYNDVKLAAFRCDETTALALRIAFQRRICR
jgi:hypothetical protein